MPLGTQHGKPDILFVVFDDLNDSVARMGGHPQARTPAIDRLMARGVRFTNAQTNCPICGPSRASFMTGIAPWTSEHFGQAMFSRVPWWDNPILGPCVTIPEHFRNHGYAVAGTGKVFHHGEEKWEAFTDREGVLQYGEKWDFGPYPWDGHEKTRRDWNGCPHQDLPWWNPLNPDYLFAPLSHVPSIAADPAKGIPGHTGWIRHGDPFRWEGRNDRDLLTDERSAAYAADFLRRHDGAAPFFLAVGFMRPHTPLVAPDEFFDLFPLDKLELAVSLPGDLDDCASVFRREIPDICTGSLGRRHYQEMMACGGEELLRRWTQAYLACVAFADAQLGKVLDALEASPHADNTIVVMCSDNGYHMGEKEQLFKNTVWEESNRVPLVVAGPGMARGAECGRPVSLLDLYPTFCDLAGLPASPHPHVPLDGHSLVPLLADPAGAWSGPDVAVSALSSDYQCACDALGRAPRKRQHYSIRSRRYRYILCNNGEEELYDHDADPYEWHNLLTGKPLASTGTNGNQSVSEAGGAAASAPAQVTADLRSRLTQIVGA